MVLSISASLSLPLSCPCSRAPDDLACSCEPREQSVPVTIAGRVAALDGWGDATVDGLDVQGLPEGWCLGDVPQAERERLEDLLVYEAALRHRRVATLPEEVLKTAVHLRTALDTAVPLVGATEVEQLKFELELRKLAMGFVVDRLVGLSLAAGAKEVAS